MGENTEASLGEMVSMLKDICPKLCPAIFPMSITPKSLDELCSTAAQLEQMKTWLASQSEAAFSFVTDIDYPSRIVRINQVRCVSELDSALTSLETMMRSIVLGDEGELTVAINRFLEANGHIGDIKEERHIFSEAYNLAYAIKILISNTAGMSIYLGDQPLPLDPNVHIGQLLMKLQKSSKKSSDEDYGDDEESDEDDVRSGKQQKKRRRKRGGQKAH